jgi:hypothetical protein
VKEQEFPSSRLKVDLHFELVQSLPAPTGFVEKAGRHIFWHQSLNG